MPVSGTTTALPLLGGASAVAQAALPAQRRPARLPEPGSTIKVAGWAPTPLEGDCAGLRSSSGAATSVNSGVSELSSVLGSSEPAPPEDGRTPPKRSSGIPLATPLPQV